MVVYFAGTGLSIDGIPCLPWIMSACCAMQRHRMQCSSQSAQTPRRPSSRHPTILWPPAQTACQPRLAMAPHLSPEELDEIFRLRNAGQTPVEIHAWLAAKRGGEGTPAPNLTNVRKALKGQSYRRGQVETRGRKRKLSRRVVQKLDTTRVAMIEQADNKVEVHWKDVLRRARVRVHPTTAARSFKAEGLDVKWRRPREKPQRDAEHTAERMEICRRWRFLPRNFFTERVDLIMDNKMFKVPTHARGLRHLKATRIRGHLRTPAEGVRKGFTKPNPKRQRVNTGGKVDVCGAIIGGRIRMWHYLPKTWNAGVAADLYEQTILPALVRHRGRKPKYLVVEDNDPVGYKSRKAIAVKRRYGIETLEWPRYSPDLNPLDFHVWDAVEEQALLSLSGPTTIKAYKAKLRRIAFALPEASIRKAVLEMRTRAQDIYEAEGGDIARD